MTRPTAWSLRVDAPRTGAENMALDHTLARELPAGRGWVRLYRWSRPTLSLGRNEPARHVLDRAALRRDGIDVVRRPTGGRAVLHDHELTYAVVAPIRALGGVRAGYALLNRGLAEGLALLGVRATPAPEGAAGPLDAGACFRGAARGEVVAAGRKLVGSAQVRIGDVLLQHGSILISDDQWRLARYRRAGGTEPEEEGRPEDPLPATLEDLLGREVGPGEVAEAVGRGFRRVLPGDWRGAATRGSLEGGDVPFRPAPDLLDHYRSPEWSWRR